jgi:dihydroorotase-like cyclic amidohydrolase
MTGTIATAADVVRCDVGIADGRIASLARDITDAREVIDASELLVMPGGIDSHVHLAPTVLGQELPALVVFMTNDDLVLNDRQLLEVFECARREKALVMVHCEGYDAIKFMTERLEAAGKTAPALRIHNAHGRLFQ